jgi:hypothetical protein
MRTQSSVTLLASLLLLGGVDAVADAPGPPANSHPAYPPSCVGLPLPAPGGPIWSGAVVLPTTTPQSATAATEMVTYAFWRTPCVSGKAALIGKITRDASKNDVTPYPVTTSIGIVQGSLSVAAARTAPEPNTVLANIVSGTPVSSTLTFVFEDTDDALVDYTQALDLSIVGTSSVSPGTIVQNVVHIPAYDSTQYANAGLPLQLSGYATGAYYDPAHSGEGMLLEVGTFSTTSRFLDVAWYTYDTSGNPYWLSGAGSFSPGDRSVTVPLSYSTGGGFAGSFGPSATAKPWGNVTIQLADCNTLSFNYLSTAGLPASVPQGGGSKVWQRLTTINGLNCQ